MRVPFSKPYRAFPELDPFSAAECRRFVEYARREQGPVRRAADFGFAAAVFAAVFVFGRCVEERTVAYAIQRQHTAWYAAAGTGLIVLCSLGAMLGLVALRDVELRAAIRRRLQHLRCPECGYSLRGLRTLVRSVTCPECSCTIEMAHHEVARFEAGAEGE